MEKTSIQPEVNRLSLENLSLTLLATVLRGGLTVRGMLRMKVTGIWVRRVVERMSNQPEVNRSSLENLSSTSFATASRGDLTVTKGRRTWTKVTKKITTGCSEDGKCLLPVAEGTYEERCLRDVKRVEGQLIDR